MLPAIKIVATPPGEAPEYIREAWVGLVLPLLVPSVRRVWTAGGVLSTPKTVWGEWLRRLLGLGKFEVGYIVNVVTAVALLERAAPWAAQWWRENTPEMLAGNRYFLFAPDVCQETDQETDEVIASSRGA